MPKKHRILPMRLGNRRGRRPVEQALQNLRERIKIEANGWHIQFWNNLSLEVFL